MALLVLKKREISHLHKYLAASEVARGSNHIRFILTNGNFYSDCTGDMGSTESKRASFQHSTRSFIQRE